jgi:hypothetical protein
MTPHPNINPDRQSKLQAYQQAADETDEAFEARVRADAEAHLDPGMRYDLRCYLDDAATMTWMHQPYMADLDWPLNGWISDVVTGIRRKRLIAGQGA